MPTATFRVLFVFIVLAHERRRVVHFGVTEHPTPEWTMQQMREAFPWDEAPRYVLRAIYGSDFATMTRNMGMVEVLTATRSPWQNPFAERLVGSIRRECLDHVIVWNERSLRRTLQNYLAYYQRSRTHLALGKDGPAPRAVEPPERCAHVTPMAVATICGRSSCGTQGTDWGTGKRREGRLQRRSGDANEWWSQAWRSFRYFVEEFRARSGSGSVEMPLLF